MPQFKRVDEQGRPVFNRVDERGQPVSTQAPTSAPPPERKQSLMEQVGQYLPSPRTAFQMGGATIGGAIGTGLAGPFGTVAGGAGGAGVGEGLYQTIQKLRGAPDAPQSLNESLGEIGTAMSGGALQEGVGAALPRIGNALAGSLYRRALKPGTTLPAEETARISNTLLKEHIPPTPKGVAKWERTVGGINNEIEANIAANPEGPISPFKVAKRVDPVIENFRYEDLADDMAAAASEQSRFMKAHSTPVEYPTYSNFEPSLSFKTPMSTRMEEVPIPATRAQAMKKSIWKELNKSDFGTVAEGYKQARKMEGVGLKEELEGLFPNIKGLNAREGRLLEARPELNRAANRISNNTMLGIGPAINAGAMNMISGSKPLSIAMALAQKAGGRTAILADILSNPVKGVTPASLPRFGVIPLKRRISSGNPNQ